MWSLNGCNKGPISTLSNIYNWNHQRLYGAQSKLSEYRIIIQIYGQIVEWERAIFSKYSHFVDKQPRQRLLHLKRLQMQYKLLSLAQLRHNTKTTFSLGTIYVIFLPPWGEWADLAGTAIASQPVRWVEQAPNCISSSKNQGDNRRRM